MLVSCFKVMNNSRKLADGMFLDCCTEVAKQYPEIEFDSMIVDNTCMQVGIQFDEIHVDVWSVWVCSWSAIPTSLM